uniref:ATP-dependent DNA helicase n=1 Tax=uncultured Thiotrichaceae bacterium TaxID=298394 RepID=A0A6S6SXP4_9GAMM|nr:MAG: ATP-dependent DNA helicase [uncultured Thiotrichaceae bacterium]
MHTTEILSRIQQGEDSTTQFKLDMTDANRLADELVAFSNAEGGVLLIGVEDQGKIAGLDNQQISRLNQLISNTANENVKPPIYPLTEIVSVQDKKIIAVHVRKGVARPYQTNKGLFLTKSGSDKRKMSSEELRRLFATSQRLFADEETLNGTDIGDINTEIVYDFLNNDNPEILEALKNETLPINVVLQNLGLLSDDALTLAGNLLFGKLPQRYTPSFYIDCVHFAGNDVDADRFIDKSTIKGTLRTQYEGAMQFLRNNLRHIPQSEDFNAQTRLEIDERVFGELIVNALVHRDYYIQSSIKVFVFDDRIEIISPGKLPNSLTVDKIKNGLSVHRNPVLNSISKNLLPYSGYGSGIKRVLRLQPDVQLVNDKELEVFSCRIPRT